MLSLRRPLPVPCPFLLRSRMESPVPTHRRWLLREEQRNSCHDSFLVFLPPSGKHVAKAEKTLCPTSKVHGRRLRIPFIPCLPVPMPGSSPTSPGIHMQKTIYVFLQASCVPFFLAVRLAPHLSWTEGFPNWRFLFLSPLVFRQLPSGSF